MSGPDVAEVACLRAAGFAAAGQVSGNAVLNFAWWDHDITAHRTRLGRRYQREFNWMDLDRRAEAYADLLFRGLRTAAERAAAQCVALGGDGVIGLRLQVSPYPGDRQARQFTAVGTAVRATGSARAAAPFLACVPAPDFASLLAGGWVPADIAIGTACVYDGWSASAAPRRWGDGNRELKRWTGAVEAARAVARDQMRAKGARSGADGIVLASMDMTTSVHNAGIARSVGGYCVVEVTAIGTAIASFGAPAGTAGTPSTVIGLRDQQGPRWHRPEQRGAR